MIELTGNQQKIDAFIGLLEGYEILEQARTGIAGLGRGTEEIVYITSNPCFTALSQDLDPS